MRISAQSTLSAVVCRSFIVVQTDRTIRKKLSKHSLSPQEREKARRERDDDFQLIVITLSSHLIPLSSFSNAAALPLCPCPSLPV